MLFCSLMTTFRLHYYYIKIMIDFLLLPRSDSELYRKTCTQNGTSSLLQKPSYAHMKTVSTKTPSQTAWDVAETTTGMRNWWK